MTLTIANTQELLHKLEEGQLDFALVEGFFEKRNYDYEVFRREEYVGIASPSHPLAAASQLSFEELFGHTLITREKGSGTREMLERALMLDCHHIEDFKKMVEISNINAIKIMVEQGCGISFLYKAAVERELSEGTLAKLSVRDIPRYHNFTFIWRKNSIFGDSYREILRAMTQLPPQ